MAWTWSWHPHPEVWLLAAALLGGYHLGLGRLRGRAAPGETPATRAQVRNFTLALIALVVAAEWPVHDLSEGYLYSVHMVQHLILTMAVAPLALAGIPAGLVRALVPPRAMRAARALTRPLVALAIFNAVIVFTHWPTIVTASVRSELVHFSTHLLLVVSALIMWTPVLSPVLELPRLSLPGQTLYLFLQSLVPTVPASFLTFGTRPLYHVYEEFPRIAGISALGDQRAAGVIMKLAGGAILWAVIATLFFRWHRLEQAGVDALEMRDLDRTLNRMELKA
jgi:putative membrane protein